MTDLDVVLTEIQTIKKTQDKHGNALDRLAEAATKMAVQNEQIISIQAQCSALWQKNEDLVGPAGVVTKMKEHQGGCPKDEMHRTFRWMWAAIGVHSATILAILAGLLALAGKVV